MEKLSKAIVSIQVKSTVLGILLNCIMTLIVFLGVEASDGDSN